MEAESLAWFILVMIVMAVMAVVAGIVLALIGRLLLKGLVVSVGSGRWTQGYIRSIYRYVAVYASSRNSRMSGRFYFVQGKLKLLLKIKEGMVGEPSPRQTQAEIETLYPRPFNRKTSKVYPSLKLQCSQHLLSGFSGTGIMNRSTWWTALYSRHRPIHRKMLEYSSRDVG